MKPRHPGEVLRDRLHARRLYPSQLADHIGVSRSLVCDLINGRRDLSDRMAVLLGSALGPDAETWARLQMRHDLEAARSKVRKLPGRLP